MLELLHQLEPMIHASDVHVNQTDIGIFNVIYKLYSTL